MSRFVTRALTRRVLALTARVCTSWCRHDACRAFLCADALVVPSPEQWAGSVDGSADGPADAVAKALLRVAFQLACGPSVRVDAALPLRCGRGSGCFLPYAADVLAGTARCRSGAAAVLAPVLALAYTPPPVALARYLALRGVSAPRLWRPRPGPDAAGPASAAPRHVRAFVIAQEVRAVHLHDAAAHAVHAEHAAVVVPEMPVASLPYDEPEVFADTPESASPFGTLATVSRGHGEGQADASLLPAGSAQSHPSGVYRNDKVGAAPYDTPDTSFHGHGQAGAYADAHKGEIAQLDQDEGPAKVKAEARMAAEEHQAREEKIMEDARNAEQAFARDVEKLIYVDVLKQEKPLEYFTQLLDKIQRYSENTVIASDDSDAVIFRKLKFKNDSSHYICQQIYETVLRCARWLLLHESNSTEAAHVAKSVIELFDARKEGLFLCALDANRRDLLQTYWSRLPSSIQRHIQSILDDAETRQLTKEHHRAAAEAEAAEAFRQAEAEAKAKAEKQRQAEAEAARLTEEQRLAADAEAAARLAAENTVARSVLAHTRRRAAKSVRVVFRQISDLIRDFAKFDGDLVDGEAEANRFRERYETILARFHELKGPRALHDLMQLKTDIETEKQRKTTLAQALFDRYVDWKTAECAEAPELETKFEEASAEVPKLAAWLRDLPIWVSALSIEIAERCHVLLSEVGDILLRVEEKQTTIARRLLYDDVTPEDKAIIGHCAPELYQVVRWCLDPYIGTMPPEKTVLSVGTRLGSVRDTIDAILCEWRRRTAAKLPHKNHNAVHQWLLKMQLRINQLHRSKLRSILKKTGKNMIESLEYASNDFFLNEVAELYIQIETAEFAKRLLHVMQRAVCSSTRKTLFSLFFQMKTVDCKHAEVYASQFHSTASANGLNSLAVWLETMSLRDVSATQISGTCCMSHKDAEASLKKILEHQSQLVTAVLQGRAERHCAPSLFDLVEWCRNPMAETMPSKKHTVATLTTHGAATTKAASRIYEHIIEIKPQHGTERFAEDFHTLNQSIKRIIDRLHGPTSVLFRKRHDALRKSISEGNYDADLGYQLYIDSNAARFAENVLDVLNRFAAPSIATVAILKPKVQDLQRKIASLADSPTKAELHGRVEELLAQLHGMHDTDAATTQNAIYTKLHSAWFRYAEAQKHAAP